MLSLSACVVAELNIVTINTHGRTVSRQFGDRKSLRTASMDAYSLDTMAHCGGSFVDSALTRWSQLFVAGGDDEVHRYVADLWSTESV